MKFRFGPALRPPAALLTALLMAWAGPGSAALVNSDYRFDAQTGWRVELSLHNDGSLAEMGGFTVFFGESLFADLQLVQAPSGWDTLVIAPSLTLPAAGFLDAYALAPELRLTPGQLLAGFTLQFSYLGNGMPEPLNFDIVDAQYQVLASGLTGTTTHQLPEPDSLALLGLACLALAVGGASRHTNSRATPTAEPLPC